MAGHQLARVLAVNDAERLVAALPVGLQLDIAETLAKGVAPHRPISASAVDRVRVYVYNARGELLCLRRQKPDDENHNPAGTWEMIQGKVNPGESPEAAALRELWEEVAYQRADLASWRALTPWVWEAVLLPGVRKPRIGDNPDEEHDYFVWRPEATALQWMGRRVAKAASPPSDAVEQILRAVAFDDFDRLAQLIAPELGDAASEGVVQGMSDADVDDPEAFSLANADAVDYAVQRTGDLVAGITKTTKQGLRTLVSQALEKGWSGAELATAIEDSRLFSADRAQTIARTEIAVANSQGNLMAWQRSGVVRGKKWLMSNVHDQDDECDENEAAGVIPLDATFPSGHDTAPSHPNCACVVVPVVGNDGGD